MEILILFYRVLSLSEENSIAELFPTSVAIAIKIKYRESIETEIFRPSFPG
ncbi:hypothetical protein [Roseofilum casamattae]|uniref:Uncharacterized protein n=1 Tax=Roseofilum casamattae BLCC-M143 TaxID=3022442 RepID=A0ABT7C0E4_9CYAN|nr:hypothetical protein [Roseofilum casamattae]MDJ1184922.1 hypothetical protein [Roseofilum casamattae BLCC-M143]